MQDNVDHVSFRPSVEVGCVANILEEYTETSSWSKCVICSSEQKHVVSLSPSMGLNPDIGSWHMQLFIKLFTVSYKGLFLLEAWVFFCI
jgi:hypothetical protein